MLASTGQSKIQNGLRRSQIVDVQLVQNVQNLHEKNTPAQEGCEGLEIDKDDRQGGVVRASGSASTTTISIQTAHNPRTEEIA